MLQNCYYCSELRGAYLLLSHKFADQANSHGNLLGAQSAEMNERLHDMPAEGMTQATQKASKEGTRRLAALSWCQSEFSRIMLFWQPQSSVHVLSQQASLLNSKQASKIDLLPYLARHVNAFLIPADMSMDCGGYVLPFPPCR